MVLYKCNICKYETIRKNQYHRHLDTLKHIRNIQQHNDSINNENTEIIEKNEKNVFCGKSGKNAAKVVELEKKEQQKNQFICEKCCRKFTRKHDLKRHILMSRCKDENESKIEELENELEELKSKSRDTEIKNLKKILEEKDKCIELIKDNRTINNTNNIKNIDNSRTTNYLNITLPDMIDIDTFIKNLSTSHILKEAQTRLLLDIFNSCGVASYGNCLSKTLRENCYQQIKDMGMNSNGIKMLPMVATDSNLRSHKEMHTDGWKKVDNDKKINEIISISNDQVYRNHSEPIYLNSKERKKVGNIIKKDHGINELEKMGDTKYLCYEEENEDKIDLSLLPEYDNNLYLDKITDCGREYIYDKNDNVFTIENDHKYIGRRLYDDKFKLYYVDYI